MKSQLLMVATCMMISLSMPVSGQELKLAGFVESLPQPSVACKDYYITNQTPYAVRIRFDNLDAESYQLNPGRSVTYQKKLYCSSPAYLVADYYNGRTYTKIGRNIALDFKKSNFAIARSGGYVFILPR